MTILAIDLGTQSIRAALVSNQGKIIGTHQISHDISSPHEGWAEQSPEYWWNSVEIAIESLLKKNPNERSSIRGIISCGQMHGPVGIKHTGEITTPMTQIWCDKRTKDLCTQLKLDISEVELAQKTGNPITTGWAGIKVKWIKEHTPEIYQKTDYFLVPKDFINFKLTGSIYTDFSEASGTYLFDVKKNAYSADLADILQVDLQKFAPIVQSYQKIGTLKSNLAQKWQLSLHIPVFAGGGDFIVSLVGIGMVEPGIAVDMTGTSTLFVVQSDQPLINPNIQNLKHVLGGWLPFVMLDTGGLNMKWCKDFLNSTDNTEISYEKMIQMAQEIPIGSEGLMFFPYLMGERRSENINTPGCVFGLRLKHKLAHLARAVMEGTALALGKDIQYFRSMGVPLNKVFCVGGATRNRLLYQMKADIMQLPMILTDEPESSLKGCAILARYGLGDFKEKQLLISKISNNQQVISPNLDVAVKYHDLLQEFIRFYDHLLGFWA